MKTLLVILLFTLMGCSGLETEKNPTRIPGSGESISKELVGIYTGSFDPPTNAHKGIMLLALKKYPLDELYVFVNVSGAKDFKTSFFERKTMIEGMLAEASKKVRVIPVLQENKNEIIGHIYSRADTVQFIGQDSFLGLPEEAMRDPKRKWVVFPRGDGDFVIPQGVKAEIMEVRSDTSSSEIRALVLAGKIHEAEIDPFVARFIVGHGLYVPLSNKSAEKEKVRKFENLFKLFKTELRKEFPKMDLRQFEIPKYLSEQSESAWEDKFTNAVIKSQGIEGDEVEEFRTAAQEIFTRIKFSTKSYRGQALNPCHPKDFIQLFN